MNRIQFYSNILCASHFMNLVNFSKLQPSKLEHCVVRVPLKGEYMLMIQVAFQKQVFFSTNSVLEM